MAFSAPVQHAARFARLPPQVDEFDAVFQRRLHRLQQGGGTGHAFGMRFLAEGAEGARLSTGG